MQPNRPLGMLESCPNCGGKRKWTGRSRHSDWRNPPFGAGPRQRVVSAELVCPTCSRIEWPEVDMESEPGVGHQTYPDRECPNCPEGNVNLKWVLNESRRTSGI